MMLRPKRDAIRSLSLTAGHVIATASGFVVCMSIAALAVCRFEAGSRRVT
jgi:hypothetical protein